MPLGTYKEALSARATDSKITDVSQDGGIVSALLWMKESLKVQL